MAGRKPNREKTGRFKPLTKKDIQEFLSAKISRLNKARIRLFEEIELLENEKRSQEIYLENLKNTLNEKKIDIHNLEEFYYTESGVRMEHEKDTPCAETSIDLPEITDEYERTEMQIDKIEKEIEEKEKELKNLIKGIKKTKEQIAAIR